MCLFTDPPNLPKDFVGEFILAPCLVFLPLVRRLLSNSGQGCDIWAGAGVRVKVNGVSSFGGFNELSWSQSYFRHLETPGIFLSILHILPICYFSVIMLFKDKNASEDYKFL